MDWLISASAESSSFVVSGNSVLERKRVHVNKKKVKWHIIPFCVLHNTVTAITVPEQFCRL